MLAHVLLALAHCVGAQPAPGERRQVIIGYSKVGGAEV